MSKFRSETTCIGNVYILIYIYYYLLYITDVPGRFDFDKCNNSGSVQYFIIIYFLKLFRYSIARIQYSFYFLFQISYYEDLNFRKLLAFQFLFNVSFLTIFLNFYKYNNFSIMIRLGYNKI